MLTKDEEKDLEETLEDFIYTQFQYYVQGTDMLDTFTSLRDPQWTGGTH